MSEKSERLAAKLLSEGERTTTFFSAIAPEKWTTHVHGDEAHDWDVRAAFEHLILSEESLRSLFRGIATGTGKGAEENFSIDAFNAERKNKLADLSIQQLFERFSYSRNRTAEFVRGLSDAQLALIGRHPAMGICTLEDMLKMIYLHNTMHVKDVKKAI